MAIVRYHAARGRGCDGAGSHIYTEILNTSLSKLVCMVPDENEFFLKINHLKCELL